MLQPRWSDEEAMSIGFMMDVFGDPEATKRVMEECVYMASDGVDENGKPIRQEIVDGNGQGQFFVSASFTGDDPTPALVVFPLGVGDHVHVEEYPTWEETEAAYDRLVAEVQAGTFQPNGAPCPSCRSRREED